MARAMKSSGLGWAGDIPTTWDTAKICLVARLESGHTPSRQHPEYWVPEECTIPWFSLADVWQLREGTQDYLGETTEKISPIGLANSAARILPTGTVVLSRTASVGFAGIMPQPMATTQDFANWVCGDRLAPEYLLFVLRAMSDEFRRQTMGSTHQTIYMPDLRRLTVPVPSREEQLHIVRFLRAAIPRLDELITKKVRLVELLQEERQALIHQAVTRGLNQAAQMKPSGVELFGPIPRHWEIKRLKHLTPQVTVGIVVTPSKYYVERGVPCPRSLNIKPGRILAEPMVSISPDANRLHAKSILRKGDLVCVRTGQPGTTAVVDERFDGANCIDLIIVRRSSRFDSRYLGYFMNSSLARRQYEEGSEGALQQHFNVETAKNLLLPCPPREEQETLALEIAEADDRHARLVDMNLRNIDLLREYRRTLVTAAVTGKAEEARASAA